MKQYHDNVEHWNEYHRKRYSANSYPSREKAAELRSSIEPGIYMIKNKFRWQIWNSYNFIKI